METLSNYLKPYKEYAGKTVKDLIHIPEISSYNMNYYIGLKRKGSVSNDLIFVETDEQFNTDYYYILERGSFKFFGYTEFEDGLVLSETEPS